MNTRTITANIHLEHNGTATLIFDVEDGKDEVVGQRAKYLLNSMVANQAIAHWYDCHFQMSAQYICTNPMPYPEQG